MENTPWGPHSLGGALRGPSSLILPLALNLRGTIPCPLLSSFDWSMCPWKRKSIICVFAKSPSLCVEGSDYIRSYHNQRKAGLSPLPILPNQRPRPPSMKNQNKEQNR